MAYIYDRDGEYKDILVKNTTQSYFVHVFHIL